jgi:hypothetical protein
VGEHCADDALGEVLGVGCVGGLRAVWYAVDVGVLWSLG